MGGAVAQKGDATPTHEREEEADAESREEKADAEGGRLEKVGSPVDSMNTVDCVV